MADAGAPVPEDAGFDGGGEDCASHPERSHEGSFVIRTEADVRLAEELTSITGQLLIDGSERDTALTISLPRLRRVGALQLVSAAGSFGCLESAPRLVAAGTSRVGGSLQHLDEVILTTDGQLTLEALRTADTIDADGTLVVPQLRSVRVLEVSGRAVLERRCEELAMRADESTCENLTPCD